MKKNTISPQIQERLARALEILRDNADSKGVAHLTLPELAQALGTNRIQARWIISRLQAAGQVERVGRAGRLVVSTRETAG